MPPVNTTKDSRSALRPLPQCSLPIRPVHLDSRADCHIASDDSEAALYEALHSLQVSELSALSLKSLQCQCRLRGLRVSGKKSLLVERILSAGNDERGDGDSLIIHDVREEAVEEAPSPLILNDQLFLDPRRWFFDRMYAWKFFKRIEFWKNECEENISPSVVQQSLPLTSSFNRNTSTSDILSVLFDSDVFLSMK